MNFKNKKISWTQFLAINDDTTSSFEDLCRLLFKKQFFGEDKIFVSKPNHPGVEIFPIFEQKTGKWISFQAKFFSARIDYSQIKRSVKQTIKYHSEDLDILYLYCNKDVNPDSKGFTECERLLNSAGIEIRIIANKAILDYIIEKPRLAEYFFGQYSLDMEWFKERLEQSLDSMGSRYNKLFNVSTDTEKKFKFFLKNSETIKIIEQKRNDVLNELRDLKRDFTGENESLANAIITRIQLYRIDNSEKIEECLIWKEDLQNNFSQEFSLVRAEIENTNEIKIDDERERRVIKNKVYCLQRFLDIPLLLEFSKLEQNLIRKKVLVINGEAGMGKSQLLSESANDIIKGGGHVILLPGHAFLSSESIKTQILSYLGLSIDFHEFLDVLETIGELANEKVHIFVDAINESNNKEVWKTGLSILFREIEKLNFVKILVSLRSGYEDSVLDHNIKQKITEYEIPQITHHGFQNDSIDAIREFLNYYAIPFSPSYFLQSEMINPLFLTMFCATYDGKGFDLYRVLEKYLEASDREAQKFVGLPADQLILDKLIREIAKFHLKYETYGISEQDLLELKFWNRYGLTMNKLPYLSSLTKSGILLAFMSDGEEMYRFGYNLLEDFLYAKVIIDEFSCVQDCKKYLREELLKINDNVRIKLRYIDTFIATTSLYFEKFNEECIDIIDDVKDEHDRQYIFKKYVKSFSWRPSQNIDCKAFVEFINEKGIDRDIVFSVFTENSVKIDNPLNAEFIHDILINIPLNERDYLWTTYINALGNEDERLFQLVSYFDEGKKLGNYHENTWLLLLLFSWLLTSSNRLLRDKASKAVIELLKTNFSFCLPLLKKFEIVNDPYVIQRLYGIVFGACTKNIDIKKPEFKALVEYIYAVIFDKDLIYPDILLRDYVKLIIEYFLFKFPECKTNINELKIKPPYSSDPIPIAEKAKEEYDGGLNTIAHSMAPENADRMYGDFGRYVFDSALDYFSDVDSDNIYNYSMNFIENVLGYKNSLFSQYDKVLDYNDHDRHNTNKIERIGKKYQWITMYNILARVSDHYKLSDRWNEEEEVAKFDGTWNPYVRDFDPTLNNNFFYNPNRPIFVTQEEKGIDFIEKDASREEVKKWVNNKDDDFFTLASDILILDESQNEWVALDYYSSVKSIDNKSEPSHFGDRIGVQDKWIMAHGYFIRKDKLESLKSSLANKNFMGRWFPEGHQNIYWLFNREFGWASGYKALEKDAWLDYEVETGNFETVRLPNFRTYIIDDFYDGENEQSVEHNQVKYKEYKKPIKKLLAKVMNASNRFLWEEQYDASQNEATSFDMPCGLLIDDLELEQQEYDGYYYDKNNEIVAFYSRDSEKFDGSHKLLIRKKHLDKFLDRNQLSMFWICFGEKRFMVQEIRNQEWSEWSGFLTLTDNGIVGDIRKYDKKKYD